MTLPPKQWAYQPDVLQVFEVDCVAALLDDPSDLPLNLGTCREAMKQLPVDVAAWHETKKCALLDLLQHSNHPVSKANISRNTWLDLAALVFECTSTRCMKLGAKRPLIGWQRAICHSCISGGPVYGNDTVPMLQPNKDGAEVAMLLAPLLGLDPLTATVSEFDQKAARFICTECKIKTKGNMRGRPALTWRDCVRIGLIIGELVLTV